MERTYRTLRLELAGRWSAADFANIFAALRDLYGLRLMLELLYEERLHFRAGRYWPRDPAEEPFFGLGYPLPLPPPVDTLIGGDGERLLMVLTVEDPRLNLTVCRIAYGSPGISDLAGAGAVLESLRQFVSSLIDRHDSKRSRVLADERAQLENDKLRIENARALTELAKDVGYAPSEVRALVLTVMGREDTLARLVDQKKVLGASLIEEQPPK